MAARRNGVWAAWLVVGTALLGGVTKRLSKSEPEKPVFGGNLDLHLDLGIDNTHSSTNDLGIVHDGNKPLSIIYTDKLHPIADSGIGGFSIMDENDVNGDDENVHYDIDFPTPSASTSFVDSNPVLHTAPFTENIPLWLVLLLAATITSLLGASLCVSSRTRSAVLRMVKHARAQLPTISWRRPASLAGFSRRLWYWASSIIGSASTIEEYVSQDVNHIIQPWCNKLGLAIVLALLFDPFSDDQAILDEDKDVQTNDDLTVSTTVFTEPKDVASCGVQTDEVPVHTKAEQDASQKQEQDRQEEMHVLRQFLDATEQDLCQSLKDVQTRDKDIVKLKKGLEATKKTLTHKEGWFAAAERVKERYHQDLRQQLKLREDDDAFVDGLVARVNAAEAEAFTAERAAAQAQEESVLQKLEIVSLRNLDIKNKSQIEELLTQTKQKDNANSEHEREIKDLQAEAERKDKMIKDARNLDSKNQSLIEELLFQIKQKDNANSEHERKIEDLQAQVERKDKMIKDAGNLDKLKKQLTKVKGTNRKLEEEIEELKTKIVAPPAPSATAGSGDAGAQTLRPLDVSTHFESMQANPVGSEGVLTATTAPPGPLVPALHRPASHDATTTADVYTAALPTIPENMKAGSVDSEAAPAVAAIAAAPAASVLMSTIGDGAGTPSNAPVAASKAPGTATGNPAGTVAEIRLALEPRGLGHRGRASPLGGGFNARKKATKPLKQTHAANRGQQTRVAVTAAALGAGDSMDGLEIALPRSTGSSIPHGLFDSLQAGNPPSPVDGFGAGGHSWNTFFPVHDFGGSADGLAPFLGMRGVENPPPASALMSTPAIDSQLVQMHGVENTPLGQPNPMSTSAIDPQLLQMHAVQNTPPAQPSLLWTIDHQLPLSHLSQTRSVAPAVPAKPDIEMDDAEITHPVPPPANAPPGMHQSHPGQQNHVPAAVLEPSSVVARVERLEEDLERLKKKRVSKLKEVEVFGKRRESARDEMFGINTAAKKTAEDAVTELDKQIKALEDKIEGLRSSLSSKHASDNTNKRFKDDDDGSGDGAFLGDGNSGGDNSRNGGAAGGSNDDGNIDDDGEMNDFSHAEGPAPYRRILSLRRSRDPLPQLESEPAIFKPQPIADRISAAEDTLLILKNPISMLELQIERATDVLDDETLSVLDFEEKLKQKIKDQTLLKNIRDQIEPQESEIERLKAEQKIENLSKQRSGADDAARSLVAAQETDQEKYERLMVELKALGETLNGLNVSIFGLESDKLELESAGNTQAVQVRAQELEKQIPERDLLILERRKRSDEIADLMVVLKI